MDTALVKFFILWIICENIVLATSTALKGTANEDNSTRKKRSPANGFSLFGLNPISAAQESFNAVGNIFSGNHGNQHHQQHYNNYQEPIEVNYPYGNVRNAQGNFPSRNGIPNQMAQNNYQNRYDWPQDNKNEVIKKTVPDKKQKPTTKTVPEKSNEVHENTSELPSNGEVDKQLLDYIFQNSQFNYDAAGTTVDNSIDFVTATGEFETTTDDFKRMLPPAAVASLLG
ncbi:hypothetical protein PYW07_015295 [Mythimna separata]|uniref:Uncharacterized protein n=1 Tax=Mythimna separata TaxID=271217 RepID=A0AAD7YZ91_MYTSE|nr:hypothetical protein PYW07_015295 [Mythimna separata]